MQNKIQIQSQIAKDGLQIDTRTTYKDYQIQKNTLKLNYFIIIIYQDESASTRCEFKILLNVVMEFAFFASIGLLKRRKPHCRISLSHAMRPGLKIRHF